MVKNPFKTPTILKSQWKQPGSGSADPYGIGMVCSMQGGAGGGWYGEMMTRGEMTFLLMTE